MKIKQHSFFAIIFCLFGMNHIAAAGTTVYISAHGNDKNPGTQAKPVYSLAAARDRLRQLRQTGIGKGPLTVLVMPGEYFMKEELILDVQDGGTAASPVIYKAEKAGTATFYGGFAAAPFIEDEKGLWKTFIPQVAKDGWTFEQLYVNDKRAQRAKYPNSGCLPVRTATQVVTDSGRTGETILQRLWLSPNVLDGLKRLPSTIWQNATVNFYHKWNSSRRQGLRFSAADSAMYMVTGPKQRASRMESNAFFTLENFEEALDTAGEWWLRKDGWLYYKPRPGEDIATTKAMVPVNSGFVRVEGAENNKIGFVSFENLSFKVAGYTMPLIGDNPEQSAALTGTTFMFNHVLHISIANCEVAHTGTNAIWFQKDCSDSKVEHCYLHDLGAGAVKIGEVAITDSTLSPTNGITVDNCIIRSGGHVFASAAAVVVFHASDNIITHNDISDFRYSGISLGWVWGYKKSVTKRNKVEYNHIHHLGWGLLSDMGGVYTLGESEGSTVNNNVVHHIYSVTYGGWGLYTDEGSSGIRLENNLVYACKSSGFYQHYGRNNTVHNNIFANSIIAQLEAGRVEPYEGFVFTNNIVFYNSGELCVGLWDKVDSKVDSNCYWDTRTKNIMLKNISFAEWQRRGKDSHSIIADPGFIAPGTNNFKIAATSPALSIGFKPFDYSRAGVYGTAAWKKLAELSVERINAYKKMAAAGRYLD